MQMVNISTMVYVLSKVYAFKCLFKSNDDVNSLFRGGRYKTTFAKLSDRSSLSSVKMKVSVRPFPHSNCTKKYEMLDMEVTDKQLCAGGQRGKDSCSGDSGGPLMLVRDRNHWFAAGVVSYGLGCGRKDWPGVYTNITTYYDWIKDTILKNDQKKKKKTAKH